MKHLKECNSGMTMSKEQRLIMKTRKRKKVDKKKRSDFGKKRMSEPKTNNMSFSCSALMKKQITAAAKNKCETPSTWILKAVIYQLMKQLGA